MLGKLVECFLGDQHGAPGAIHIRGTASADLLWRRRHVKFVHEERKMEHFRRRFVERHKAIFSVEHFLQSDVNEPQQVVQVVG